MQTDRILGKLRRFSSRLRRDRQGAIAVQAALITVLLTSTGVLAVDIGRVLILKTQLQNLADAVAMAAAVQLDGQSGAISRSTAVAQQAVSVNSRLATTQADFVVETPTFYRDWTTRSTTNTDAEAIAVRVTVAPASINLMLQPVFDLLWPNAIGHTLEVRASAAAQNAPIICNAPPLMMCDPTEDGDATLSLTDSSNIGRQMLVKGDSVAPGNYGLLCVPNAGCGASDIEDALIAVNQPQCTGTTVETAPGQKTGPVVDGIAARFGTNHGTNIAAPNVIAYPRDSVFGTASSSGGHGGGHGGGGHGGGGGGTTATMGAADWNISAYWSDRHGTTLPADLSGATRYQTYLYELGETFARNGRQTYYPVPTPVPGGFSTVVPPAANIPRAKSGESATNSWYDGVPDTSSVEDPKRRVIKAVVLKCQDLGVSGHGTYPSSGTYVDFFITEPADQQNVYGELVGAVTRNRSSDFHANVRLLE